MTAGESLTVRRNKAGAREGEEKGRRELESAGRAAGEVRKERKILESSGARPALPLQARVAVILRGFLSNFCALAHACPGRVLRRKNGGEREKNGSTRNEVPTSSPSSRAHDSTQNPSGFKSFRAPPSPPPSLGSRMGGWLSKPKERRLHFRLAGKSSAPTRYFRFAARRVMRAWPGRRFRDPRRDWQFRDDGDGGGSGAGFIVFALARQLDESSSPRSRERASRALEIAEGHTRTLVCFPLPCALFFRTLTELMRRHVWYCH